MPQPRIPDPLCAAIQRREWSRASSLLASGEDPNSLNEALDNAVLLACVMAQYDDDMVPARQLLFDLVVAGGDPEQCNGVQYSARIYLDKFASDYPGWHDTIDSALSERQAQALEHAGPHACGNRPRRSL